MKTLLILLIMLSLQADKILIPTMSYHTEPDLYGVKVNQYNYGIGYQKSDDKLGFNTSITASILNDSFNHAMASLTYGVYYKTKYNNLKYSTGFEFGGVNKKILYKTNDTIEYKYHFIPVAFIPTVSISKGRWSLEALHVPEMNFDDLHIMQVTLFLIGYKFD